MDTKQKFVRLKRYNEVIIFPCVIEHSEFKNLEPVSAGKNEGTKPLQVGILRRIKTLPPVSSK